VNGDGGDPRIHRIRTVTSTLQTAAVFQTGDSSENRSIRLGINPDGVGVEDVEQIGASHHMAGRVRGDADDVVYVRQGQ
jgi:hypothetical protein